MSRKTKGGGKVKGALGAFAGLLSGAAIMYFTPLLDKVFKPDAPVANFEVRQEGLTVTFRDLTDGPKTVEGWWDFGDGTALAPLVAGKEVRHTYARGGRYIAKLKVRNLLDEESERSVTLRLDSGDGPRRWTSGKDGQPAPTGSIRGPGGR
jgi:hypothetical protein